MRRAAALVAVYAAAAVALTWPLATRLGSALGAPSGPGDPYLNAWILGWGMRAWLSDPVGTLMGRAFDAPIFHPSALTLTYSDHLLPQALLVAPVYALTDNLALCYNLVLLTGLAGSGLAMHVLAREVSGSHRAALVAGLIWLAWPYRTAHFLHLQLQALYFLPLAIAALLRVAAGRRWSDAAALGLMAAGQALSSVYYGVMTALALALSAIVAAWQSGQWRARRYWTRVLVGAGLAGALVVPVALPYLRAQQIEGFGRNLYEAANHAASLQSYTQVPPANLLYGRTGLLAPRAPGPGERDRRHVEHQMFPGITALLLALAGAAIGWRRDQRVVVAVGVTLVIAGGVLSMGPEFPGGLYQLAASTLPGFDAIRAPARFGVVVMLGLSLLAAVGMRFMLQRAGVRRERTMLAVIIAMVAIEYANAPMSLAAAPVTDTATGRWLRDAPEPGAVVYLPVGLDIDSTPVMIEALQHGRPIVNGYSGQRPSNYVAIAEALSTLPAVEGLAMLRELDVRFVVSDRALDIRAASSLIERARVDGRVIYEVAWTPDAEAALLALDGPDVPPPGAIPFVAGEILTFAVRWIGDVPAGTITLRTEAPSAEERTRWPHAAWRFVAAASTAPWVSRFFEARDVFTTIANDTLLPIAHLRQIDEGARKLTRAYVYDGERRQVRTAATVEEASSTDTAGTPWSGAARDAISTLYYVRTLDLDVGREWRIPVNDAGRSLLARVSVEGRERVTISGASVDAWRLRVVIERRLERRQPVSGTLWLSADAERAPLGLDIAAGFGAVHVERVDYRP